jgi:hypothetical protein
MHVKDLCAPRNGVYGTKTTKLRKGKTHASCIAIKSFFHARLIDKR